ncbi:MAG: SCO family protein [Armatimonadota bacterium]|nr:SCO family protein [Armatimonadota bacterium]MDR7443123.1 SCO family protein [Armatimonadota bacterium]MDR7569606.1 SCO family protein [Armatimonadota bacterium]MDR7614660.1 SCO family protein [Armatimonadota bacterium]
MARSFVVLACLLVAACQSAPQFRGEVVDPPRPVPDLVARDHRGRLFRTADQRGSVVVYFFGYTHCPDVCPGTLAKWKRAQEKLGEDARRIRWVFVTVDPERDTARKVGEYLGLFSPEFVGLVGTEESLRPFYRAFGVLYEKVPQPDSAVGYLVGHTAFVPVVDALGRWRLRFNFGTSVEDYVHDLRLLVREARRTQRAGR